LQAASTIMAAERPSKTALLVIDIQEGFKNTSHWGPSRSNPKFEGNASSLITSYRSLIKSNSTSSDSRHKLIHIAHSSLLPDSPLHPTQPGFAFQSFAAPLEGELVITKHVNSGFIGTDLEKVLRTHFGGQPGLLFIIGLTTDHCVSTTTRMAGNLRVCDGEDGTKGEVFLVTDATAAWKKGEGNEWFEAEIVHSVNVESLREFATITKTEQVLGIWKGWQKE
jgi:nicotinamidase-related amidase